MGGTAERNPGELLPTGVDIDGLRGQITWLSIKQTFMVPPNRVRQGTPGQ